MPKPLVGKILYSQFVFPPNNTIFRVFKHLQKRAFVLGFFGGFYKPF